MRRARSAIGWLAVSAIALGCDDKPVTTTSQAQAPPTIATQAPVPKPAPNPLAGLVVDELGLYLQTHRIDMAAKDAEDRLKAAVAGLPVKQKAVPIEAARNAKTQHVGALARALGQAGAVEIDVKTPSRGGADAVLKLLPEQVAGQAPECAVVAMIKKDNTTAVWRLKGGTATKFSKGLAGPDMSMTYDGMKDQMASCASVDWFLAGEDNVIWGLIFDLGLIVARADPPPKATNAVLLYEAPVAGRAVSIAHARASLR
jgi:hypothetical protein